MNERTPKMSEDTYVVDRKLQPKYYTVRTDAYRLGEQIKKALEAGIRCQFYFYVPQLEQLEEKRLIRDYELDDEKRQDQPVPPEFMRKVFAIDGIYLASNLKTSDKKLKIIQEAPGSSEGKVSMRELDDFWEICLDPVTADVLGIEPSTRLDGKKENGTLTSPSEDILREINRVRHSMGLTYHTIRFKIEEKRERSRTR